MREYCAAGRIGRVRHYPVKSMLGRSVEMAQIGYCGVVGDDCVEQGWIGRTLAIGDEVVVRIVGPTGRCGMVAFAQDELPHDPQVLRHIAKNAGLMFGVYAEVVRTGTVRVGDTVTLDPAADA